MSFLMISQDLVTIKIYPRIVYNPLIACAFGSFILENRDKSNIEISRKRVTYQIKGDMVADIEKSTFEPYNPNRQNARDL